jgi:serine/threonine protein phosphatase PrpC
MDMQTHTSRQLVVRFGGASSAGVKPGNQDAFAAHQPEAGVCRLKGAVACIADGLSCSEQAQQASQTAVTQFIEDYYSTPDTWSVKTAAARVLSSMNSWFFHQGQASAQPHHGLVTTFSAVICKSTTAHIFHVGDSRIYRLRGDKSEQLTRDHHHLAGDNRPCLTRALGADSRLEVDYLQSREMLSKSNSSPLLERNPLRVWQVISAVLLALVLLQFYLLATEQPMQSTMSSRSNHES